MELTIYYSWQEVNEDLETSFSNDDNVEDPVCIIAVYKWTYDGETEPPFFLNFECIEHIALNDKWDLFAYER